MRRSRWARVFAVFAGGLFALTLVEPPHARACPMHDAAVAEAPSSAHAHHTDAAQTTQPSAPADNEGACCTCLGDCVGTAGTSAVTAPSRAVPVVVVHADELPSLETARPATRTGLELPFANGPPLRV